MPDSPTHKELETKFAQMTRELSGYKRRVADLVRSQDLLGHLFQNWPDDGVFAADRQLRLQMANQTACEYLGLDSKEAVGQSVWDLLLKKTNVFDSPKQAIAVIAKNKGFDYHGCDRDRDGHERYLFWRVTPFADDTGHCRGFIGKAVDTTGVRKSEAALKESQARFKFLSEATIEGIHIHDRGVVLDANPALAKMLGYQTPDEVIGVNLVENHLAPESLETVMDAMDTGFQGVLEITAVRCDGTKFPVELNSKKIWYQGRSLRVSVSRDITEQVQTQALLTRQNQILAKSLEIGKMGSWELDAQAGRLIWSDENYKIFDIPMGTHLTHNTFLGCVHPEDRAEVDQAWNAAIQGNPYDIEHRILVNQRVKWVREKGAFTFNAKGHCLGGIGFTQDITEQKLVDEIQAAKLRLVEYAATHSSRELIQKFLDETEKLTDSQIGFYHYVDVAQKNLRLVTWSTNTLKKMCKMVPEATHYPIADAGVWVDAAKLGRPVVHNDYQSLEHKKGLPRGHAPVIRQLVVPVVRGGKIKAILGVGNKMADYDSRDVQTVHELADLSWETILYKAGQESLENSEKKYRSIMEAMSDGLYICSADYRIEYMNPAMVGIVGNDATGGLCYQHINGFDRPCSWCIMDAVQKKQTAEIEVTNPRDRKVYHISSVPLENSDHSVSKISIYRDMTAIKESQKKLEQAQKMESLGSLAGGIAHDFNNILFPIMGNCELLLEDLPDTSDTHGIVKDIFNAGHRGADLVQQILSFSRQSEHRVGPVKIQQVFKEVLKLMRATLPSDIQITEEIQSDCGAVMADPVQIHQVGMNLVTNAFHAVEKMKGVIGVNLKAVDLPDSDMPAPDMMESGLQPGRYARIRISDNGHGIPREIMDKIFNPYFTTKALGKGTGLGLSVVYGIVKKLDGEVRVNSRVGRGTVFSLYFPIVQADNVQRSRSGDDLLPRGCEHILVVDDEDLIVALLMQLLERQGYRVTGLNKSPKALALFQNNPRAFDLVITDMTMPLLTGDRLATELIKIRPEVPVIICTGFSERIDEALAEQIGIKGFLKKPVVRSDLAHMVRRVLDNSKADQ